MGITTFLKKSLSSMDLVKEKKDQRHSFEVPGQVIWKLYGAL